MKLELRKDSITDRWVGVVVDRPYKPEDFFIPPFGWQGKAGCPFCAGNEHVTPSAIEVYDYVSDFHPMKSTVWDVRVVANKFPALSVQGEWRKREIGLYDISHGFGVHEVIIETPHHYKWISDLEEGQIANIIKAYRSRSLYLRQDERFKYILIFKNVGMEAGASLEHGHSQLIALPLIPKSVEEEIAGGRDYYKLHQRCNFCDIITYELKARERIVLVTEDFIAFCPFSSRFAFEVWILPIRHIADFAIIDDKMIRKLARVFKEVLGRLKKVLREHSYNYVLHTTPVNTGEEIRYHWHIEIMPKLAIASALEWSREFYVVHTPPEYAAQYLRDIQLSSN